MRNDAETLEHDLARPSEDRDLEKPKIISEADITGPGALVAKNKNKGEPTPPKAILKV